MMGFTGAQLLTENGTEVLVALLASATTILGGWLALRTTLRSQIGRPNGRGDLYKMVEDLHRRLVHQEHQDLLLEERQNQLEGEHADQRRRLQHIERTTSGRALGDPYDWEVDQ